MLRALQATRQVEAMFRVAQSTISRLLQRVNALTGDVLTALRQVLDVKTITYET